MDHLDILSFQQLRRIFFLRSEKKLSENFQNAMIRYSFGVALILVPQTIQPYFCENNLPMKRQPFFHRSNTLFRMCDMMISLSAQLFLPCHQEFFCHVRLINPGSTFAEPIKDNSIKVCWLSFKSIRHQGEAKTTATTTTTN